MESSVLEWLAGIGAAAFRWSAMAFLVVNGVAIATLILTRDRALVNRWTGRVLAANLVLAGTGLGIPLVTAVTRLAVAAVLPGGVQRVAPEVRFDDGAAAIELEVRSKD
jgi:ABC-type molybdate transport system permease subunit